MRSSLSHPVSVGFDKVLLESPITCEPIKELVVPPCSHSEERTTLERCGGVCPTCREPFEMKNLRPVRLTGAVEIVSQASFFAANKQLEMQDAKINDLENKLDHLKKETDTLKLTLASQVTLGEGKEERKAKSPLKYNLVQGYANAVKIQRKKLGAAIATKIFLISNVRSARENQRNTLLAFREFLLEEEKNFQDHFKSIQNNCFDVILALSPTGSIPISTMMEKLSLLEKKQSEYRETRKKLFQRAFSEMIRHAQQITLLDCQQEILTIELENRKKLVDLEKKELEEAKRLIDSIKLHRSPMSYDETLNAAIMTGDIVNVKKLIIIADITLKEFALHDILLKISRAPTQDRPTLIEITLLVMQKTPADEINRQNDSGDTALHLAVLTKQVSLVRALLLYYQAAPSLHIKNHSGDTPATLYQKENTFNIAMEILLNIEVSDNYPKEGQIPVTSLFSEKKSVENVGEMMINTIKSNNVKQLITLLKNGMGNIPITWAPWYTHSNLLRAPRKSNGLHYLLWYMTKQADPNIKKTLETMALVWIGFLSEEMINEKDSLNADTALHWACFGNNDSIVAELIRAGADPNIKNINEKRAYEVTDRKRYYERFISKIDLPRKCS